MVALLVAQSLPGRTSAAQQITYDYGTYCYTSQPTCTTTSSQCAPGMSCLPATDGSCVGSTVNNACTATTTSGTTWYACYNSSSPPACVRRSYLTVDRYSSLACYGSQAECESSSSNSCLSSGGTRCVSSPGLACSDAALRVDRSFYCPLSVPPPPPLSAPQPPALPPPPVSPDANLIAGGGFEESDYGLNRLTRQYAYSPAPGGDGWTFSSQSGVIMALTPAWGSVQAYELFQFAFLQGAGASVSKTLTGLVPGATYRLQFAYIGRPAAGTAVAGFGNDLQVEVGGVTVFSASGIRAPYDVLAARPDWIETMSSTWVAPASGAASIVFRTTNPLGGDRRARGRAVGPREATSCTVQSVAAASSRQHRPLLLLSCRLTRHGPGCSSLPSPSSHRTTFIDGVKLIGTAGPSAFTSGRLLSSPPPAASSTSSSFSSSPPPPPPRSFGSSLSPPPFRYVLRSPPPAVPPENYVNQP